ncbi:MAG: periplasmic heavy metal sensor [Pseudomonadota bacterium]|jgi:uncharacterized membrane protein
MSSPWWQRSSLLPIVLLASLGANLFLAGWLLGGHSMRPPPPPPMDHFDDQIHERLSADGAKIMRTAFETIRRRFEAHGAEARAARERQMAVLKAEPFNPDDYVAALQSARTERDAERALADQEIARAIALLSAEDRRQLAMIRQRGRGFGPPR